MKIVINLVFLFLWSVFFGSILLMTAKYIGKNKTIFGVFNNSLPNSKKLRSYIFRRLLLARSPPGVSSEQKLERPLF